MTKICNFPYPIYDQTKNLTLFKTVLADTVALHIIFDGLLFMVLLIMMKKSFLLKGIPNSKLEYNNHTLFKTKMANRYPIYDQNGQKTIPFGAAHTYIVHVREYPGPTPGVETITTKNYNRHSRGELVLSSLRVKCPHFGIFSVVNRSYFVSHTISYKAFKILNGSSVNLTRVRPHLYGLGYPSQPSSQVTLAEVIFHLFLCKIRPTVYKKIANPSRGARQLEWASCLASAGRVTLTGGTTFLHLNTLARLTETILGVVSVTSL